MIPLTKAIDDTDITTMFNTDVLEQKYFLIIPFATGVNVNHSLVTKNILDLH